MSGADGTDLENQLIPGHTDVAWYPKPSPSAVMARTPFAAVTAPAQSPPPLPLRLCPSLPPGAQSQDGGVILEASGSRNPGWRPPRAKQSEVRPEGRDSWS